MCLVLLRALGQTGRRNDDQLDDDREAEAGGSLQVPGHPGLLSKFHTRQSSGVGLGLKNNSKLGGKVKKSGVQGHPLRER